MYIMRKKNKIENRYLLKNLSKLIQSLFFSLYYIKRNQYFDKYI